MATGPCHRIRVRTGSPLVPTEDDSMRGIGVAHVRMSETTTVSANLASTNGANIATTIGETTSGAIFAGSVVAWGDGRYKGSSRRTPHLPVTRLHSRYRRLVNFLVADQRERI